MSYKPIIAGRGGGGMAAPMHIYPVNTTPTCSLNVAVMLTLRFNSRFLKGHFEGIPNDN